MISKRERDRFILYEDDQLLIVDKPAGIGTHAASRYGGEGVHEWLCRREPRWASLSIIQRLDKDTSGVLVFGKTREANRSLSRQFEGRSVTKTYVFRTDRDPGRKPRTICTPVAGTDAETELRPLTKGPGYWLVEATPKTGRTHQVRAHARDAGLPVLGDERYGGAPFQRLCLHAAALELAHPLDGRALEISAPAAFDEDPRLRLCEALWPAAETTAWRLVQASDERSLAIDRVGDYLLSSSDHALTPHEQAWIAEWCAKLGGGGAYHKILDRHVRGAPAAASSPLATLGAPAPARFEVRENRVRFWASFEEGYSIGLFLDQRDNRRRLLSGHVFPGRVAPLAGARVLNTFAYTCSFSVVAALAGATTTSVDLSKKYLDWGRENFVLNGLDPTQHDFIYGDCFEWLKRLGKKSRAFDVILLDPPTFSQSKAGGVFKAEKDYARLVDAALPLLAPGGLLFCSTNSATLDAEEFVAMLRDRVSTAGRKVEQQLFVPQPPDFAPSGGGPGYLKTVWLTVM